MFTGLITDIATIEEVASSTGGRTFTIATSYPLAEIELGESIAVNGACLTVTQKSARSFSVDASLETLDRTTLGDRVRGDRVHLERALRVGDRMGGHFVLGHVDGVGALTRREQRGNAWLLEFSAPPEVADYLIEKGSVTIDGVSLTVNHTKDGAFGVAIIPFTSEKTNLADYRPGRRVNLEADVVGKYVRKFVDPARGIDAAFLAQHGFAPGPKDGE